MLIRGYVTITALLCTMFLPSLQFTPFIKPISLNSHFDLGVLRQSTSQSTSQLTRLNGFLGLGGGGKNKPKTPIEPVTLTRYMSSLVVEDDSLREMEGLILSIQMACKTISTLVNRAGITQLTGLEGDVVGAGGRGGGGKRGGKNKINVQGEEVKKVRRTKKQRKARRRAIQCHN